MRAKKRVWPVSVRAYTLRDGPRSVWSKPARRFCTWEVMKPSCSSLRMSG